MLETPRDLETERSLLATVCHPGYEDEALMISLELQEEDFFHPDTRMLYRAMKRCLEKGIELSALTLRDQLTDVEQRQIDSQYPYPKIIDILQAEVVGTPKVLSDILIRKRQHRDIIRIGERVARDAANEASDPETLIRNAQDEMNHIVMRKAQHEISSGGEVYEWIKTMEPFASQKGLEGRVALSGLHQIDTSCIIPAGEPVIIGARPGCGKTALGAVQIPIESIRRLKAKPLVVQLELTKRKFMARVMAYLTGTDSRNWRKGDYGEAIRGVYGHQETLDSLRAIYPPQGTPWPILEASIRKAVASYGCDFVVLDYFGYIGRPTVSRGSSEAYAFAKVMEGITSLSKSLDIGMIVLAQLKQESEMNKGKRPGEGSFADSDRPYRDSNIALMMWRDQEGLTHICNPKNRDGVPGQEWTLSFDGATGRFREMAREIEAVKPKRKNLWE